MSTGGIIAIFFGAAFLIAVLIATRAERYLRAQNAARLEQRCDGFIDFDKIAIQLETVGQGNARNVGAAIVDDSSEEDGLPDLTETSCKPRAALEFLGFGRTTCLSQYPSAELTLCLAPSNQIPMNGILGRRHSRDGIFERQCDRIEDQVFAVQPDA